MVLIAPTSQLSLLRCPGRVDGAGRIVSRVEGGTSHDLQCGHPVAVQGLHVLGEEVFVPRTPRTIQAATAAAEEETGLGGGGSSSTRALRNTTKPGHEFDLMRHLYSL